MSQRTITWLKVGGLLLLLVIGYSNGLVFSERISDDDTIEYEAALIFGGGMKQPGVMSDILEDRAQKGVELYKDGMVPLLVMTGDGGSNRVDEVWPMRSYARGAGVFEDDIHIDPVGFNTYLSCSNAYTVLGLRRVVVVSQSWHLPRIVYYCRSVGLSVTGVPSDLRVYGGPGKIWGHGLREVLARVKAVMGVQVLPWVARVVTN